MGLYGDKKDYEEMVKDNIYKARILSTFPKKYHEEVLSLLAKKEEIKQKNGLFSNFELRKIDKKISKLKATINKS